MLDAVASGTDFFVDLEAALQLLAIELAERAIAGQVQFLGLEVVNLFSRQGMGFSRRGIGAAGERIAEHHREEGADEKGEDADHCSVSFRLV